MPVPETTRALTRALSPRAHELDHPVVQADVGISTARPAPRRRNVATWRAGVLAGLAGLALVAAIGALLAPVVADHPVVHWPKAGQQPRSTVLPLVPYRPLSLHARVPCAALAALNQRPEGGDALRTLPATAGKGGWVSQGLVIAVHGGVVQVSASGRTLLRELLPADPCTYRVLADAGGVRVLRDDPGAGVPQDPGAGVPQGAVRGAAPVPVPQVNELATDVEGQREAAGLAVTLNPDSRYQSTPTATKIALLGICAAALLVLLGLAWRWWGGDKVSWGRLRLRAADAVLVVVSVAWVVLAPTNFDDSWYELMARGANASGSVGNAIYMFNIAENPFVASQYVLQAWGALGQVAGGGWGLAWMRLVPLIYGLVTWLLLRLLLATFDPELDTSRAAWALLVAYLLWWLPYGITLRPEPLIVLLAAATLLLSELARRRHSVGVFAVATTTAALAISVSPSGLVAAAPLVLALPWLSVWWRARPAVARLAAALLVMATGTSLVLVGSADATLGDVLEATAVHQWYYQSFPWYQEFVHYQTILSFKDSSQWARRAPVVLTLAVLLVVALATVARARRLVSGPAGNGADPVRRLLVSSAACAALALALLAPTPTKFVNHFGAAAAAPVVLLAAALLRSPLSPCRHRIIMAMASALLVGAVSGSFAGPNIWRPYSDRGQPFGNHLTLAEDRVDLVSVRPRLGPVQLANPLLWVGVALVAAATIWWWRRHGQDRGPAPDHTVLVTGSTAIVVMTLVVFAWAPLRQYPGWSVAVSAVRSAHGQPCALLDYAQIAVDTPAQPVPVGTPITTGSFATAANQPAPVFPPAPSTLMWHNAIGYDAERDSDAGALTRSAGWLVTPWFTLPAALTSGEGSVLLIPVLGAPAGQRLTLEYQAPSGIRAVALQVDRDVPQTEWDELPVALDGLGKTRPSSVRLVVWTQAASADRWLAVGQPRLAGWRPLSTLTAGRPVYVDQLTAALLPCLDQVGVDHGIARAPEVLVLSDEGFGRGFLDLGFEVWRGGTQVPLGRSATTVRVPSRLVPGGPPTLPWGRVERVLYDHPVGLVDTRAGQLQRPGWTRLATLATKNYHGDPG